MQMIAIFEFWCNVVMLLFILFFEKYTSASRSCFFWLPCWTPGYVLIPDAHVSAGAVC
jgi:hypothetical protein